MIPKAVYLRLLGVFIEGKGGGKGAQYCAWGLQNSCKECGEWNACEGLSKAMQSEQRVVNGVIQYKR